MQRLNTEQQRDRETEEMQGRDGQKAVRHQLLDDFFVCAMIMVTSETQNTRLKYDLASLPSVCTLSDEAPHSGCSLFYSQYNGCFGDRERLTGLRPRGKERQTRTSFGDFKQTAA